MRLVERLKEPAPSFSFEFFPPKTKFGQRKLLDRIEHLAELEPTFVSVTYGAGGTTRHSTVKLGAEIKAMTGVPIVAHITCVGHTVAELEGLLDEVVEADIKNVLLLRGDQQEGSEPGELHYASELIALCRARHPHLCIGAACYPETHPESPGPGEDLDWLKHKVDQGADFLVSQLFFENAVFLEFQDRARAKGIEVPILPGLMPVTNVGQVERFTQMCGAAIPVRLREALHRWPDDEQAVMAMGIEWAIRQGQELLAAGAPGLHFYTLNKSLATRVVHASLAGLSKWS